MKKILVGFDGSEGSEQALYRAMILLDEYGELILLAVIPGPADKAFVDEEMYNKIKKKAENIIKEVITDLGQVQG
jgi:nucleotide-binding universal stress UspA family protein